MKAYKKWTTAEKKPFVEARSSELLDHNTAAQYHRQSIASLNYQLDKISLLLFDLRWFLIFVFFIENMVKHGTYELR